MSPRTALVGAQNLTLTEIRTPDRPTRSKSYRLGHTGPPYIKSLIPISPLNGIVNLRLHASLQTLCLTKKLEIITFHPNKDRSLCSSLARLNYVEVWLHSFLTSALDGGKWSGSRSGYFTPVGRLLISDILKSMLCGRKYILS